MYIAGHSTPPRKRKYRDTAKRIKKLLQRDRDDGPIIPFLRRLTHNLTSL